MINSKPIFNKKNVTYEREEKEGFWTYLSAVHPEVRELIVNKTSQEILSLCDGSRTLAEVEKEMKKRYPEVNFNRIKTDVDSILASFSRLGMIEWKGDNPFLYKRAEPITKDISMMIAQEYDIIKLIKFIESWPNRDKKDYIWYRSPATQAQDYSELALRQKLFFFAEEFYLLLKNNKLIGLISIGVQPGIGTTVAGINLIICPKEYLTKLLQYAHDNAPVLSVIDFTKIRLFEPNNKPFDSEFKQSLEKLGYEQEGKLKNEFGFEKDSIIWAYYYNENLMNKYRSLRKKLLKSMTEKS